MLIDSDLQTITPPVIHVQSDGSNIGGVPPLDYGAVPVPGPCKELLLRTSGNSDKTGKGYPAWLWSVKPRPFLPNTGTFQMAYKFMLGGDLAGANVWETDTILIATCADGVKRKFNLSLQRHIASGQIDIGNWTDTGIRTPPLTVGVEHDVVIRYAFDLTKNTCAVLSYADNGNVWRILNGTQQATTSDWDKGVIPQDQMGSLPSAQAWQVKIWDHYYGY